MATTSSNVKGISGKGIANIKSALKTYKTNVSKSILIEATQKEYQEAIKGSTAEANFKAATLDLNTKLKTFLNFLDQFDKDLDTVQANYKANDTDSSFNFVK